jgi:hypothetical protein
MSAHVAIAFALAVVLAGYLTWALFRSDDR